MGKSVQSTARLLQNFSRVITSNRLHNRPKCQIRPAISIARPTDSSTQAPSRLESKDQQRWRQLRAENKNMEANNSNPNSSLPDQGRRIPLSEVVADCMKRWFQDTLKEAKAGDTAMQVLVSQMYYSGYGITRDAQKGRAWMNRASRTRSSVWKVSDKHPGYNASDSDSNDNEGEAK